MGSVCNSADASIGSLQQVQSKSLFKRSEHKGVMTKECKTWFDGVQMIPDPSAMAVTPANLPDMRKMMDGHEAKIDAANKALWKENKAKCSTIFFTIKVEEGVSIKIYVIKPLDLPETP